MAVFTIIFYAQLVDSWMGNLCIRWLTVSWCWLAGESQDYENLCWLHDLTVWCSREVCVVLSPMPRYDLVLIRFLQNQESSTRCTEFSSHTNTRSLLLSGKPNHHHLSSASDVCQVTLKACHLSIYSGGGQAQLRACRMALTRHPQTWVSPAQLSTGKHLPLYMGS